MKSLKQHILERLLINKNFNAVPNVFDTFVMKYLEPNFDHNFSLNRADPKLFSITFTTPMGTKAEARKHVYKKLDEWSNDVFNDMMNLSNKKVYAWRYGKDTSNPHDYSEHFIHDIKEIEDIETLIDEDDYIVQYYKTDNFMMLKYGMNDNGRFVIADIRENNKHK